MSRPRSGSCSRVARADLETICHKCLHKEPGIVTAPRSWPRTCAASRRASRSRPRPVGQLERGWRRGLRHWPCLAAGGGGGDLAPGDHRGDSPGRGRVSSGAVRRSGSRHRHGRAAQGRDGRQPVRWDRDRAETEKTRAEEQLRRPNGPPISTSLPWPRSNGTRAVRPRPGSTWNAASGTCAAGNITTSPHASTDHLPCSPPGSYQCGHQPGRQAHGLGQRRRDGKALGP